MRSSANHRVAFRADWQKILRKTFKLENGKGWSFRELEIKRVLQTQVKLRHQKNDSRKTSWIPFEWSSRKVSMLTSELLELKSLIDDRNLTIKEAEKFRLGPNAEVSAVRAINWASIAYEFINSRSSNRLKTQQDLKTQMDRFLEIFKLNKKPINVKLFMTRFAENISQKFQIKLENTSINLKI
tara:strand:+ start:2445 stop:2996 length:552 start_codon:yes stop_codon:yes gene_type:complete